MAGTIIITGANGSLAIPAVKHLLTNYPDHTAILTVRNGSNTDGNTKKLREMINQYPDAKTSIRELDLADLLAVHDFAATVSVEIAQGRLPPLASIVCNAYHWNLVGNVEITRDGYEKSFQVTHLAHVALVLRLIDSFGAKSSRVVLLSSDAHEPGKNGLEKYPPTMPDNLELLIKPASDKPIDNFGRGFQRYAVSKLAVNMWMYALNRHLKENPSLSHITAVAINPGSLADSRALQTNTPAMLFYLSKFIIQPLRPLLRFIDPMMRTSAEAGADVVDLATNKAYPNEHGYFTLLAKDTSSLESRDEEKQRKLWIKSAEWARITNENTALKAVLE